MKFPQRNGLEWEDGSIIGADRKIEPPLPDAAWSGLYPNSSVLSPDEEKLYIGMRQFVGEFDLAAKKLRVFIPAEKFLNKTTPNRRGADFRAGAEAESQVLPPKNISAAVSSNGGLVRRDDETHSSTMNTSTATSSRTEALRQHPVVPHEQWLAKRKELLRKEKELTHLHDQLAAERRDLPWERVEKNYLFDAPSGKVALADLFAGRSQLVIYHFMFGPDWQEGCPSCSYVSDHIDAALPHLAARDVTVTMVSRAPLAKIEAFKKRLGWQFHWVSSNTSDFNADFRVSFTKEQMAQGKVDYNYTLQEFPSDEAPGLSVFYKNAAGEIFHTYSTFGRGLESLLGTYMMLDLVPKGRDEEDLEFTMAWVRYHDRYDTNEFADADKPYWPETAATVATTSCGCGAAEGRA